MALMLAVAGLGFSVRAFPQGVVFVLTARPRAPRPTVPLRCTWSWKIVTSPSPDPRGNLLTGVAAVSPSDVWAVGGSGGWYSNRLTKTLVEHWDGSRWRVVPSPNSGSGLNELTGVAAAGPDDIWAVGYTSDDGDPRTLIEHWGGRRWNVIPSPSPGTGGNYLYAVTAIGADDVWAVGASGDVNFASGVTLIEHWDGTSWTVVGGPDPSGQGDLLFGVAAASSQDVWAVGYRRGNTNNTQPLIERWDGTSWSTAPSPIAQRSALHAVAVVAPDDAWAVGPPIERWDGRSWTLVPAPAIRRDISLWGVAAAARDRVWAVGDVPFAEGVGNQPQIARWDGRRWRVVVRGVPPGTFASVTALPGGDAWAVGFQGRGAPRTLIESRSCGILMDQARVFRSPA